MTVTADAAVVSTASAEGSPRSTRADRNHFPARTQRNQLFAVAAVRTPRRGSGSAELNGNRTPLQSVADPRCSHQHWHGRLHGQDNGTRAHTPLRRARVGGEVKVLLTTTGGIRPQWRAVINLIPRAGARSFTARPIVQRHEMFKRAELFNNRKSWRRRPTLHDSGRLAGRAGSVSPGCSTRA